MATGNKHDQPKAEPVIVGVTNRRCTIVRFLHETANAAAHHYNKFLSNESIFVPHGMVPASGWIMDRIMMGMGIRPRQAAATPEPDFIESFNH